ncbi:MAG TPA: DUF998 domain-containing protein [Methanomassiliicoccales archaeon]|jgi:hypothetical membrane protein
MNLSNKSLAGILFFVSAAWFMTILMICEAIAPGYSMNANAISDLGIISQSSLLFNASIFVVGILNIAGGYLYYQSHRRRYVLAMFTIAGIGAMGVGIFTLNTPGLHGIFALVAFLFFNLQAIAVAGMLSWPLKHLSIILGLIGLVYIAVMFVSDSGIIDLFGSIGHGGTERMIVYPSILWLMVFGGYLMGKESRDCPSPA